MAPRNVMDRCKEHEGAASLLLFEWKSIVYVAILYSSKQQKEVD